MAPGAALVLTGFDTSELQYSSSPQVIYGDIDGAYTGGVASFFGDNFQSMFGSPGLSWSDPYISSCASSFEIACASPSQQLVCDPAPSAVASDVSNLLLCDGTTDDSPSEFDDLQQFSTQTVMHPNLVDTLKDLVETSDQAPETSTSPYFDHFEDQHMSHYEDGSELERRAMRFLEQQLGLATESPPMSQSDVESGWSSQDGLTFPADFDEVEVKHEPPPLNNKRLERVEDIDDSVEAAEVSVDLIQNRRPFRCGQEGCNKTFKNPQTMKMHHKTHYSDGSAISADGLPTLPTLMSSPNSKSAPGTNKKIPSRCPKCRKTFVGLYELRRHYGRKHSEGEKPHGCRKCGKRFYIEVDVRDHEKLCGEPIECKCGLKFAFKCNLVAHKKAHPVCAGQDQRSKNSYSSNNPTSDEDDSSRSSSSPRLRHGTKRHRAEPATTSASDALWAACNTSSTTWPSARSNLPGVGLATPVYASKLLSSLNNYYFSPNFASRKLPTSPRQISSSTSTLDQFMHLTALRNPFALT